MINRSVDAMVGELAGALEAQIEADGPRPGTVLAAALLGQDDAAPSLLAYARDLLGVSEEVAREVLGRFSSVLDFTSDVFVDIDQLEEKR